MSHNKALMVDGVHLYSRMWAKPLKKFGRYYPAYNGKESIQFYEMALKNEAPYTLILFEEPLLDMTLKDFLFYIRQLEEKYQAKPTLIFSFREKENKEKELKECDEYYYGEFDPQWLIQILDEKYKYPRKILHKPYRGFGKTSY